MQEKVSSQIYHMSSMWQKIQEHTWTGNQSLGRSLFYKNMLLKR